MHEIFDEEEREPVERRPDTEVTLGPMLLLGLFFGLVLLCGLCFGLGYSMGSHSTREASTSTQPQGDPASSQAAGSLAKPSAVSQVVSPPQPPAVDQSSSGVNQDPGSPAASSTSAGDANPAPPVVKPALSAAATTPAPVSAQSAPVLKSALSGAIMVQIATVSQQEDADVLVGALRKRGYAVTARRDPADNQLHVRIGPFSNQNDANATRQKLLRDGYNAIVQP
jgi:cell division septation protein DedD